MMAPKDAWSPTNGVRKAWHSGPLRRSCAIPPSMPVNRLVYATAKDLFRLEIGVPTLKKITAKNLNISSPCGDVCMPEGCQ